MDKLNSLRLQIFIAYLMIALSAVLLVFALGFMTGFFTLFMDGTNEMFTFFKDVQILNNALFSSSLIMLVMSLILIPFDINKQTPGLFSLVYVLIVALINIMNGITVFTTNSYFSAVYGQIDFSGMEGYVPSQTPFVSITALYIVAIAVSLSLAGVSLFNFFQNRKKGSVTT